MKGLFILAYGFAWGYVVHAKEIDKKLAVLARDAWEEFTRTRVRVEMAEYSRQIALAHNREDLKTPESELHATG